MNCYSGESPRVAACLWAGKGYTFRNIMGLTIDNIINTWPLGLGVVKHGSVKVEDVGGLEAAGLGGPCLDFSPAIGIGSVGGLGGPLQKKCRWP